jgi:hypothetical protein
MTWPSLRPTGIDTLAFSRARCNRRILNCNIIDPAFRERGSHNLLDANLRSVDIQDRGMRLALSARDTRS